MNWTKYTNLDALYTEAIHVPQHPAKRNYVISGWPEHGKTTFAGFLAESLGTSFRDTSDYIYEQLAAEWDVAEDFLRSQKKSEIREYLVRKGNELCEKDPGALVNGILRDGHNIVAGVRRVLEFQATDGDPTLIWIEREGHDMIADNTEVGLREIADIVLHFEHDDVETMRIVANAISV